MNSIKSSQYTEFLFYCFIIALPFEELISIDGLAITKLIGLCLFAFSLSNIKFFYGSLPPIFFPFFLYITIGVSIDLINFPLDLNAVNSITRPLLMFILMLITYNLTIRGRASRIIVTLYLSSLIYTIVQFFEFGKESIRNDPLTIAGTIFERLSAFNVDANFAACYISLNVIASLVYLLCFDSNRRFNRVFNGDKQIARAWFYRIFALMSAIIGFYGILKTSSRGGMLSLFVGLSSILLTTDKFTKKIKYAFLTIFCFTLMIVAIANDPLLTHRFTSSIELGEIAGRTFIWEKSISLFMDSPIYGYGYYMQQFKLGEETGYVQRGTHNLFLSVLLGTGLLGFCFFLYFYFRMFKTIWLNKTEGINVIVFPLFIMSFVASLSINLEISKWLWIVWALALGAGKSAREESYI